MELFDIGEVKLPKLENPHKVLQTLKKIQFIMEFFVLSRYSSNPDVISEFLMAIEAFKFYYKMAHFTHQENIYLENHEEKPQPKKEFSLKPLEKMSRLLEQIKTKTYECKDYQPEQF